MRGGAYEAFFHGRAVPCAADADQGRGEDERGPKGARIGDRVEFVRPALFLRRAEMGGGFSGWIRNKVGGERHLEDAVEADDLEGGDDKGDGGEDIGCVCWDIRADDCDGQRN